MEKIKYQKNTVRPQLTELGSTETPPKITNQKNNIVLHRNNLWVSWAMASGGDVTPDSFGHKKQQNLFF